MPIKLSRATVVSISNICSYLIRGIYCWNVFTGVIFFVYYGSLRTILKELSPEHFRLFLDLFLIWYTVCLILLPLLLIIKFACARCFHEGSRGIRLDTTFTILWVACWSMVCGLAIYLYRPPWA